MTDRPKPPDLLTLVQQFGGYSAIPIDAWARWDRQMETYRQWLQRKGG